MLNNVFLKTLRDKRRSMLFWGIAVIAHYWVAYRTMGHEWIERETDKILREQEGELGKR